MADDLGCGNTGVQGYVTDLPTPNIDAFAREAVAFIDQHKSEPLFLYVPCNAVHASLQASEHYLGRSAGIKDPKRPTFAAMLTAMDDAVGRVMGKLAELKLNEQTLLVDARFRPLDKDADGRLSAAEFPRPKVFRQMDRDRDGSVTLEEAKACWAARR